METLVARGRIAATKKAGTTSVRYVYLDALRGVLLAFMAINHIPSDLQPYTNHIFGYVSAAEGFVFLAGLTAGLVYTRKRLRSGPGELWTAAIARAGTLYRYHLITYFVVFALALGYIVGANGIPANIPMQMVAHPWLSLLTGPLFLFQPPLLDILPMYCGFILLVPLLISACENGTRGRLLAGSFALWGVTNAFSPQTPLITTWMNTGAFNICAWQVLFVTGTVFGHAWMRGERLLPSPRASVLMLLLIAGVLLYGARHTFFPTGLPRSTLDWLTNKNNLAPLRLLNAALIFYLVHVAVARFPHLFNWRPFALLGRASITVFAAHIPVAYLIEARPQIFASTAEGRWLGTAAMFAVLFLAAGAQAAWRSRPASRSVLDSALATRN